MNGPEKKKPRKLVNREQKVGNEVIIFPLLFASGMLILVGEYEGSIGGALQQIFGGIVITYFQDFLFFKYFKIKFKEIYIMLSQTEVFKYIGNIPYTEQSLWEISLCVIGLIVVGACVPIIHGFGRKREGFRFYQPFSGGKRYIMLQILTWTIYGYAILFAGTATLKTFNHFSGNPNYFDTLDQKLEDKIFQIKELPTSIGKSFKQPIYTLFLWIVSVFFSSHSLSSTLLLQVAHLLNFFASIAAYFSHKHFDQKQTKHHFWFDLSVMMLLVSGVPMSLLITNHVGFLLHPSIRLLATLTLFAAAPLTHLMAVRFGHPFAADIDSSQSLDSFFSSPPDSTIKLTLLSDRNQKPQNGSQNGAQNKKRTKKKPNLNEPQPKLNKRQKKDEKIKPNNNSNSSKYKLWQPFLGGEAFVFLQMLGWALYSIALLTFLSFIFTEVVGPVYHVLLGTTGFIAQLCVLISLYFFERHYNWQHFTKWTSQTLYETWLDLISLLVAGFFYQIPLICFSWMASLFFFFSFRIACLLLTVFLTLYMLSYNPKDQENGSKKWNWFINQKWFWDSMCRYFSARLILASPKSEIKLNDFLSKDKTYLYGFHPHGIYPVTCVWLTLSTLWKKALPGIELSVCGASILLKTPIVRNIFMWAGGREVTRKAIYDALSNRISVLLIPGGQKEMRYSVPNRKKFVIVTSHTGFVRISLSFGVSLVPIFSFGEDNILQNINLPSIQEITYKILGFGFPHFPYGRWYSAIPNATKITVVVGKPIEVPLIGTPTDEEVKYYHKLYFDNLRELFEKYKKEAGFEDSELVYI